MQSECIGQVVFQMPGGRGRKARTVRQEIRMQRLSLSDGKKKEKDDGKEKGKE